MSRYAVLMLLLGVSVSLLAFRFGGAWMALLWLAGNFLLLAVAYAANLPRILGKRPDGSVAWWGWVIFLPYHFLYQATWHILRVFQKENPVDKVTPTLSIGRRLLDSEVSGEFANYIDLTAEFSEPKRLRESPSYVGFAILDAGMPHARALRSCLKRLRQGATFVHCAQGHGRTGLFSIALLLESGEATSAKAALKMLQQARPALRLTRAQFAFAEDFERGLGREPA